MSNELFSARHLVAEHTKQKRIYGTVHSEPVVTRTVVAVFTTKHHDHTNATRCVRCMIDWYEKKEESPLINISSRDIRPDMILSDMLCKCGKYVHPLEWTSFADHMLDRASPRYILIRYKTMDYEGLAFKDWWTYTLIFLDSSKKPSDLHSDEWLIKWCDGWNEV